MMDKGVRYRCEQTHMTVMTRESSQLEDNPWPLMYNMFLPRLVISLLSWSCDTLKKPNNCLVQGSIIREETPKSNGFQGLKH